MINCAEAVEFVKAWNGACIFEIGQPADVDDELRTAVAIGELITGMFNVAVSQAEALSHLTKAISRKHLDGTPRIGWQSRAIITESSTC